MSIENDDMRAYHEAFDNMTALLDEASKLVALVFDYKHHGSIPDMMRIRIEMFASAKRYNDMRMENLRRGLSVTNPEYKDFLRRN